MTYLGIATAQKLASQVLGQIRETIHHPSDCIKTQSELAGLLENLVQHSEDLDLILLLLERRREITRSTSAKLHDCIIKFKVEPTNSLQSISEQDEGIAILKSTSLKLERQTDALNKKIQEYKVCREV
jgi:hypothetical protein